MTDAVTGASPGDGGDPGASVPPGEPGSPAVGGDDATDAPSGPAATMPGPTGRTGGGRGFWSRPTLLRRLEEGNLIRASADTGAESRLVAGRAEAACYRLTLGDEVYVSPSVEADDRAVRQLEERQSFVVPAGQFAFLITDEVVEVPADAIAFIALRTKDFKFRGLVNVSGFHVDPGYVGRLVFAVFNAGPREVGLRRGDEMFAIFFAHLDAEDPATVEKAGFDRIPSALVGAVSGGLDSFAGLRGSIERVRGDLDRRLGRVERDHSAIKWAAGIVVGALIAVATGYASNHIGAKPTPAVVVAPAPAPALAPATPPAPAPAPSAAPTGGVSGGGGATPAPGREPTS